MQPFVGTSGIACVPRLLRCGFSGCVLVFALTLAAPTDAQTPGGQPPARPAASTPSFLDNIKWDIDLGAQGVDLDGDRPGKFTETRDVAKGFFVRNLRVNMNAAGSPAYAFASALNVRQLDQRVQIAGGRIGRFRSSFVWDQLPRSYSDGHSPFTSPTPGVLQVSPSIRAAFQSLVDGQVPPAVPAAFIDLVRVEFNRSPIIELRTRRDLASFEQVVQPSANWTLNFAAQQQRINGTRPKGTGTFARNNIGGGVGDAVWESLGVELPEPVSYRTNNVAVGTLFTGARWRLGIDYNLSLFRNDVTALAYENPFRVTDAQGNPPGSAVGRFRMVNGQVALAPNTDYHAVDARGSVDLGTGTQVRGLFEWSRSQQKDQFLPYTLNTALRVSRTGGSVNLPVDYPITSVTSLPVQSLNGEIETTNHDYALVSNLGSKNRLTVQFTAEDMDNNSPQIVFPGFPRFGESHWVTSLDYYGVPVRNLPTSFTRQNVIAAWRGTPSDKVTANAQYEWEVWNRTFRDVDRTNEHSIRAWVDLKPSKPITIKGDYRFADRKPELYKTQPFIFTQNFAYTTNGVNMTDPLGAWVVTPQTHVTPDVPLEFNLLRRFDESGRRRHEALAAFNLVGSRLATFSANYRYIRDDYDAGFYGLNFTKASIASLDLTLTPRDGTMVYLNYSRDDTSYGFLGMGHLITGAVVDTTPCCAQFPIANTWDRRNNAGLDTFQIGLNSATDGERIIVDVSYVLSNAKEQLRTSNPFPVLTNSPLTAGAYDYPDTLNRWQEVDASIAHHLRPRVLIGLRYQYVPYKLDDFYLNDLQPYPQGAVLSGGVPVNLQRQQLLNARFTSVNAQLASVFLRYSF